MRHLISIFSVAMMSIVALLTCPPRTAVAQSATVAVIYPDLQEPYRSVVTAIVEGIQDEMKDPVKLFAVAEDSNPAQLNAAVDGAHVAAIIALGGAGLAVARHWQGKIPIVAGASLLTPDKKDRGIAGISLAADPDAFIAYLKQIAPGIKRVHVVYSTPSSSWLLQSAQISANKRNLQLLSYKSDDIKNSALIYRGIIRNSKPGEDAIWLLPDPVAVDERVTFPMLLSAAWDQDIVIFSSNPALVRRGALFALFPDNKEMGKSIADMTEADIKNKTGTTDNKIVPLHALQAAINIRTAEHIGMVIPDELRQKFALIFPAP